MRTPRPGVWMAGLVLWGAGCGQEVTLEDVREITAERDTGAWTAPVGDCAAVIMGDSVFRPEGLPEALHPGVAVAGDDAGVWIAVVSDPANDLPKPWLLHLRCDGEVDVAPFALSDVSGEIDEIGVAVGPTRVMAAWRRGGTVSWRTFRRDGTDGVIEETVEATGFSVSDRDDGGFVLGLVNGDVGLAEVTPMGQAGEPLWAGVTGATGVGVAEYGGIGALIWSEGQRVKRATWVLGEAAPASVFELTTAGGQPAVASGASGAWYAWQSQSGETRRVEIRSQSGAALSINNEGAQDGLPTLAVVEGGVLVGFGRGAGPEREVRTALAQTSEVGAHTVQTEGASPVAPVLAPLPGGAFYVGWIDADGKFKGRFTAQ